MLTGDHESFGDIRKIVVHDGHQGPKEIGVDPEFLEWLTDPYYNGAGALTDFGCYGANLSTWLHDGAMPNEVSAVTQQIKPDIYPKVDDEATIILTYDKSQTIIQASWNWNYSRKDIEIYGKSGFIKCLDRSNMRVMRTGTQEESPLQAPTLETPFDDPFRYFMAVIRGDVVPGPEDLSSIENNLIVMAILQGAITSARSGKKFVIRELDIE
jgi:predicted dehydrogenase